MDNMNIDLSQIGALILLLYLSSIVGLSVLIFKKIKRRETSTVQKVMWWHLEMVACASAGILIYRFFIMEISDRQYQRLLNYILLWWLGPLVAMGIGGYFLKPQKSLGSKREIVGH